MVGGGRTDNDERAFACTQQGVKSGSACHQADQIDFDHPSKSGHFEFAAPVNHRTLRQHQHVEPIERRAEIVDRFGVADLELSVIQALEAGSVAWRIVGSTAAGAADMHVRAVAAECLRDAVADATGAANHENLLSAEIQFVHRPRSFWLRLTLWGSVPALSILQRTTSSASISRPTSNSSAARLRD
jgi:hypothetical protein